MKFLKDFISPKKIDHQENYIWYNDELKICRWGSLEKFESDKLNCLNRESCKLICKPEINAFLCKTVVEEINSGLGTNSYAQRLVNM